jgi:hypothetical protein
MFGINPLNGVKKPFFRPEKWHGFGPPFYYELLLSSSNACEPGDELACSLTLVNVSVFLV